MCCHRKPSQTVIINSGKRQTGQHCSAAPEGCSQHMAGPARFAVTQMSTSTDLPAPLVSPYQEVHSCQDGAPWGCSAWGGSRRRGPAAWAVQVSTGPAQQQQLLQPGQLVLAHKQPQQPAAVWLTSWGTAGVKSAWPGCHLITPCRMCSSSARRQASSAVQHTTSTRARAAWPATDAQGMATPAYLQCLLTCSMLGHLPRCELLT